MKDMNENLEHCPQRDQAGHEYATWQVVLDNVPYAVMGMLGAVILSRWNGWAAGAYAAYTVAGAVWIMWFVCPFCHYYNSRACPCGYGIVAAKFRPWGGANRFAEKFRKHIPVIVPLWIVPVAAGGVMLWRSFDRTVLWLLVAFAVDAFVVMTLMARLYGCGHCPQNADCPWMIKQQQVGS